MDGAKRSVRARAEERAGRRRAPEAGRDRRWPATVVPALALVLGLLAGAAPAGTKAAPPAGFADERVARVPLPTALAFTPGGDMLVTSKSGQLFVLAEGAAEPAKALDLAAWVCANGERGLLGVAVDPKFAANGRIYLYYTFKDGSRCPEKQPTQRNPVNRVSRFVLASGKVAPASETVLIDNIPSPNGNHNGGDLHFGNDGNLYVSVGDGGCDLRAPSRCQPLNRNATRPNLLLGKILRIAPNGEIPTGNAFTGAGAVRCNETGGAGRDGRCREIYATGLRNPFRFAFDESGTRFFVNDVGWQSWEEIDQGQAGADYGWNLREGPCPKGQTGADCAPAPAASTDPVYAYQHGGENSCSSITGGAFVPADAGWPGELEGAYLFADFRCGTIFRLVPDDAGRFAYDRVEFASDVGVAVHLDFGPDADGAGQALYYATFVNGGELRRIAPTA